MNESVFLLNSSPLALLGWFVAPRPLITLHCDGHTEKKNANQRCSSQLFLEDRGPLFSKIIIIKTHGKADVADLTFDMCDCCVLVDSFPRDLFPLQVNLYTSSNRMQGCSQAHSKPSRESPSGVASEGISRLSSWKLLHNLASCPDPRTLQNPLMMIESVSALCWKHAESLTLEYAARLVQGLKGEKKIEKVLVQGGSLNRWWRCLMGLSKAGTTPGCSDSIHECICVHMCLQLA